MRGVDSSIGRSINVWSYWVFGLIFVVGAVVNIWWRYLIFGGSIGGAI